MKVKAGSGSPIATKRLQTFQSQLKSLKDLYFLTNSELRYEKSSDWSDWSRLKHVGPIASELSSVRKLIEKYERYQVSQQCRGEFRPLAVEADAQGNVCMCGHPEVTHSEGSLCVAGVGICYCNKYSKALRVSDIRYFFRATKGPHEAHALVLGLNALCRDGGNFSQLVVWQCSMPECGHIKRVNPVRMSKGTKPTLGATALERHKLVCEECLYRVLNGGFYNG